MSLKTAADMQAKLQSVWIKAARLGTPLVIPCESERTARKLRWTLYNTAASVRRLAESGHRVSEELREALDEVEISISEAVVMLRRKVLSDVAQVLVQLDTTEVAGQAAPAAQTEEDRLVAESLARLQAKLAEEPKPAPRSTPYYTRED